MAITTEGIPVARPTRRISASNLAPRLRCWTLLRQPESSFPARVMLNGGMDTYIDPTTRDVTGQRIDTLANAVYLRLITPLGSWWADARMGSRLHELRREKDLPRVSVLARQYAQHALQPLLDDGRAKQIDIASEQTHNGWLILHIEVVDAGGRRETFRHHVEVI